MSNTIQSSYMLSNVKQEREVKDGGYLGKDEFLKILMAQLQNQDPLNPMQDKEFIAQMASFSSLEQMMNMSNSFQKLALSQQEANLINYQQLLGKQVSWQQTVGEGESLEILEGTGHINGIEFVEGQILFSLDNGSTISPGELTEINQFKGSQTIVDASHMIGLSVTWMNQAGEEVTSTVQAVSYKNGDVKFILDDEQAISQGQIIKVQKGIEE
ncbi:hypothetical protein GCM10008967_23080 [Bacillus carboniphilus]|uniref:Basal-body rod modification protein FlgD n=1 Tax=Bacillus carboniphilus TaxID=86663 RepID=A0ABN0WCD0_9BACI